MGIWLLCSSVSEQFQYQDGRTAGAKFEKSTQEEMAKTSSGAQGWWEVVNQNQDVVCGSRAGIWGPNVETEFEFMNRIVLCDCLLRAGTTEALTVGLKKIKIIQQ